MIGSNMLSFIVVNGSEPAGKRRLAALGLVVAFALLGLAPKFTRRASASTPQVQRVTISGTIVDNSGRPMIDVVVAYGGSARGFTITGPTGAYSISVPPGGNYTLAPSRSAVTFQPLSQTLTNVTSDRTDVNFTGTTSPTFKISGTIVDTKGQGVMDVAVRLSNSQAVTISGYSGAYSFDLPADASYTLTPSQKGLNFNPPSFTIARLDRDRPNINFVATPYDQVRISGEVTDNAGAPLPDVLIGLGGDETSIVSGSATGFYSFMVRSGGNYTVTPARNGYNFSPATRSLNNFTQNTESVNFVGTPVPTFSISGVVADSGGNPMMDVAVMLTGPANNTVATAPNGSYAFSGLPQGNYTVTPILEGFAFVPPSRVLSNIAGDQVNVSFVGTASSGVMLPGAPAPGATPAPFPSPSPEMITEPGATPGATPRPSPAATPGAKTTPPSTPRTNAETPGKPLPPGQKAPPKLTAPQKAEAATSARGVSKARRSKSERVTKRHKKHKKGVSHKKHKKRLTTKT